MSSGIAQTTLPMPTPRPVPELHNGDRLDAAEFHRRYAAMPTTCRAELIEGVVYMSSPVRVDRHAEPHGLLELLLATYAARTKGVRLADNGTVRLGMENEPQPDIALWIDERCGGQAKLVGGYLEGAPELCAEIAFSSASYDTGPKLQAYRRNGVREYVIWRVDDRALDWFVLREGNYERLEPGADGLLRSQIFPGLQLDARLVLAMDAGAALDVVQAGLGGPEHQAFTARLAAAKAGATQAEESN